VWSPTNAKGALLGILNGAKHSLLIENEEMSDSDIVSALENSALRGVDVKVVIEAATEWDANLTAMTGFGAKVATYSHASIYIHAKVIIADYGTDTATAFLDPRTSRWPR
jgi:cardiolipin synthase A/B